MPVTPPIAETIAAWSVALTPEDIPASVRAAAQRTLIDSSGLIVAPRHADFVQATVASVDDTGSIVVPGHARTFTVADAALIAGTSVHGDDFDDTFEGTPVHVGSVMVPALLSAAQQRGLSGADVLRGLAVGGELMCRLTLVAPTAIHRKGFHPTAIAGAFGAAAGLAAAMRLDAQQTSSALGIVGSFASGIIEYLAEGTWTKRMHPGWAAAAGWKAVRMAEGGFAGPRTVFEGEHGAFFTFAVPEIEQDLTHLSEGWGSTWQLANLAFKPYACGTMCQPFIDCALQVRDQVHPADVEKIVARVGEGTVHRLWAPMDEKARPSTPYGAKFSGPYSIAVAWLDGDAGLRQYTDEKVTDPVVLDLAGKVIYEIDPDNEYPKNYTGEIIVHTKDGSTHRGYQPCLRGGRGDPMSDQEIDRKFMANCAFGGWDEDTATKFHTLLGQLFDAPDASGIKEFGR